MQGTGSPKLACPPGWAWKKMNINRVAAEAACLAKKSSLEDLGLEGLRQTTKTVKGLGQAFD